jgi:hypothetical protein
MKVRFGPAGSRKLRERLEKMSEITTEVPATFSRDHEEVSAEAESLYNIYRWFSLTLPRGTKVEVQDSTICEFREEPGNWPSKYDALLTYFRPVSITGTNILRYDFPIVFKD